MYCDVGSVEFGSNDYIHINKHIYIYIIVVNKVIISFVVAVMNRYVSFSISSFFTNGYYFLIQIGSHLYNITNIFKLHIKFLR
jgi:hypothetical protein